MWRTLSALAAAAALLVATGCGATPSDSPESGAPAETTAHDRASDPMLVPAGRTGTPALSQPVRSMDELSAWVREATGECTPLTPASMTELGEYLGPVRMGWYLPFVAEWATCGIAPYDRLGLVLFKPGKQREMQEFWLRGLASGEITDNPDWAFGNGFAITAGPLGAELGLHYLWCQPAERPDRPDAHIVPADVDGCVYATWSHHH